MESKCAHDHTWHNSMHANFFTERNIALQIYDFILNSHRVRMKYFTSQFHTPIFEDDVYCKNTYLILLLLKVLLLHVLSNSTIQYDTLNLKHFDNVRSKVENLASWVSEQIF